MKFMLSKMGVSLLFMIILIFYCVFDFYFSGVTGGRAGLSFSRESEPVGYYIFMCLYTSAGLCCLFLYLHLLFKSNSFHKK